MAPPHPAALYNDARRVLLSTAHNPSKGFGRAYDWLERTYKRKLGARGYIGLLAELKFYERYRREFKLTPAADTGEHADFAGEYGGATSRFDVTTNLSYKTLEDYEPFLSDGPAYKIVVVDAKSFDVSDVVSLSFRRCECGGYCLPTFVLLDQNTSAKGVSSWTNDQILVEVCCDCEDLRELERYTHHYMPSPSECSDSHEPDDPRDSSADRVHEYGLDAYKWLRREYCEELMAVAGTKYTVTAPDGDGYWSCKCIFKNSVVNNVFPDAFSADAVY